MSVKATFLVDASVEQFRTWLQVKWEEYTRRSYRTRNGVFHLNRLIYSTRFFNGNHVLAAKAMWLSDPNDEGVQQAWEVGEVFTFRLLGVGPNRVEVQATINQWVMYDLLSELMEGIIKRWPAVRENLEYELPAHGGNEFDQQFKEQMESLKRSGTLREPELGIVLEKHVVAAEFFVYTRIDDFTAWTAGVWRRKHGGEDFFYGWPSRYFQPGDITTHSDGGRTQLLVVGADIVDGEGKFIERNERCLEILVESLGEDVIAVTAACSEPAYVDRLEKLLVEIKTAYRDKMSVHRYRVGFLAGGPFSPEHLQQRPEEDEMFRQIRDRFAARMATIQEANRGQTPQPNDQPARVSEQKGPEPAIKPAVAEESIDPKAIGRFGTWRDLTWHEVCEIVKACRRYQAVGGSIPKFYEDRQRSFLAPDGPGSYSRSTLEGWLKKDKWKDCR